MTDEQKVRNALAEMGAAIDAIEPGPRGEAFGMAPSLGAEVRSLYRQLREAVDRGDKVRVCKVSTQIFGALVGMTMPPFSVILAVAAIITGEYGCPSLAERAKEPSGV